MLHSYSSTSGGTTTKGWCIYDDVELSIAENETEFLGFTVNEPQSIGCISEPITDENSSYKDSGIYAVDANNPATTLKLTDKVVSDATIYASAVSTGAQDAVLIYGRYSLKDGKRHLEAIEIAEPDESGLLSVGLTVPPTGTYTLEAFIWDGINGLKPIMDPVELGN